MTENLPEKAKLLKKLQRDGFQVPDFIFVPAHEFVTRAYSDLPQFLELHRESFKVIARSAHPLEYAYKGGTFDSLETYADISGIEYARKKIIAKAQTSKRLSIRRQQVFNNAPEVDLDEMGVIVMPFITGTSVMAKMIGNDWEFGYCRNRSHKVQSEPHITKVPHDRGLVQLSKQIQNFLGFRCEIEYIISTEGDIFVVQAKDISHVETLEQEESARSIKLDGIRRIRVRRNYRERPVYVMDNKAFYIHIISQCEELVHGNAPPAGVAGIIESVTAYEEELEAFALRHPQFAVIGFSIQDSRDLYQIANHYLDEMPDLQKQLSKVLHNNLYKIDIFLGEADTLVAKHKFRVNLCSHDAYGIDTVRNPLWSVYWQVERHEAMVKEFRRLGFKTGDTVGIEIDPDGRPVIFRL